MTGSVIDGEDVMQQAFVKAVEAFSREGSIARPRGWLFRIAHNEAIDFVRRRAREGASYAEEAPEIIDPAPTPEEQLAAASSLKLRTTADCAAQRGDPQGRARLFDRGDRQHHLGKRAGREGGAAPRPRAASRAGRRARRPAAADSVRAGSRPLCGLCRALQFP